MQQKTTTEGIKNTTTVFDKTQNVICVQKFPMCVWNREATSGEQQTRLVKELFILFCTQIEQLCGDRNTDHTDLDKHMTLMITDKHMTVTKVKDKKNSIKVDKNVCGSWCCCTIRSCL